MKSTIITALLLSVMISGYGQLPGRYPNNNEKPDRRDYVSTGCMMDPGFTAQVCGEQEKAFRAALARWEEAEKNKPKRPPAPSLEKLSARMDSFFEALEQLQADQIQTGMNDYNAMIKRTNLLGESLALTREKVDSLSHELGSQRKLLQFNTDMGNYYIRKVDSLQRRVDALEKRPPIIIGGSTPWPYDIDPGFAPKIDLPAHFPNGLIPPIVADTTQKRKP